MPTASRSFARAGRSCLALLASLALARPLRAEQRPHVDLSATLGYAFPVAYLERGSRLSDVTFGAPRLVMSGAYRVSRRWSTGLALSQAVTIPTLCATPDDCVKSLGRDTQLGLLGRWRPFAWRRFEPQAEFQFGYEWLKTRLVDAGVRSARSYRGPYAALAVSAQYGLGRHFSLGPLFALSAGAFQRASLSAPGIDATRGTDGLGLHGWLFVGAHAIVVF